MLSRRYMPISCFNSLSGGLYAISAITGQYCWFLHFWPVIGCLITFSCSNALIVVMTPIMASHHVLTPIPYVRWCFPDFSFFTPNYTVLPLVIHFLSIIALIAAVTISEGAISWLGLMIAISAIVICPNAYFFVLVTYHHFLLLFLVSTTISCLDCLH